MPATKLIVMYPPPADVQTFERLYQDEHVPMAVKKLEGPVFAPGKARVLPHR